MSQAFSRVLEPRLRASESWIHRHQRLVIITLSIVLLAYGARMIIEFGVATIDGTTYFLADDDVMITMRYARNLAQGLGPVFNRGEHVEGFTNPLLMLVGAGLHLLPVPLPTLPLLLMLVNMGFSLSIVYVLTRFWGETRHDALAGLLGAILYVALPNHSWFVYAGYEVYMLMAILLFSVWRMERLGVAGAVILGLLPLTHGTAYAAWAVLVGAIFFVTNGSLRRRSVLSVLAVLPFAGYEIFRILYYDDVWPNTAYLKVGAGSLVGGLLYLKGWLGPVKALVLLASYTLMTRMEKKTVLLGILLATHVAVVISLGGDIFPQYRFLFPCSLLLAALAGHSVSVLLKRSVALTNCECVYVYLLLGGVMAYSVLFIPFANYSWNSKRFESQKQENIRFIAQGLALRENTAPTAVVALFGLGYAGYYSERYVIDMLGKADRHIARAKPTPNREIGHNRTDFDYVIRRLPDYIELDVPPCKLADRAYLEKLSKGSLWGYIEELALHPVFRTMYAPRIYDRRGRFFPFYARIGSDNVVWNISESYYRNLETRQKNICE